MRKENLEKLTLRDNIELKISKIKQRVDARIRNAKRYIFNRLEGTNKIRYRKCDLVNTEETYQSASETGKIY